MIERYNDITILGYNNAMIERYNNTTILGYNNVMIERYNDTTIKGYNNAMIERYNDTILGYNNTIIERYNDTMILRYNNVMIERSSSLLQRRKLNTLYSSYTVKHKSEGPKQMPLHLSSAHRFSVHHQVYSHRYLQDCNSGVYNTR